MIADRDRNFLTRRSPNQTHVSSSIGVLRTNSNFQVQNKLQFPKRKINKTRSLHKLKLGYKCMEFVRSLVFVTCSFCPLEISLFQWHKFGF